jgi:HTH-type transcriptional regulator/antitoxin HipB
MPDADPTPTATAPVPNVSGYVRRARRLADLSQRDLAAHIGLAQPRVARIEGGRPVDVATFARILATAGLRIAVVDGSGTEVPPMPDDVLRDAGRRRQPAHLDVRTAPEFPSPTMVARHREPDPRESWHHRREERDRRRAISGSDASVEQPTARTLAAWHLERRQSRLAAAQARARQRPWFDDDFPEDIHLDPSERDPARGA